MRRTGKQSNMRDQDCQSTLEGMDFSSQLVDSVVLL